ncbi:MAG: autotransporter outer membrane beta-barrel domain-containing protein [Elusimicrobia bacterium]|nr:autotransporter outer membrane beta-barrel domain-containing protein [Elusimicrobiota bacterium]
MITLASIFVFAAAAQATVPDPVIPPGTTLVQTWTGADVNQYLEKWSSSIIPGVTDPFDTTKPVYEVTPAHALNYVRLYSPAGGSGPLGSWMMSAHAVRGLTPQQLRNIFALPALPTNIVQVRVPAGTPYGLWTGIAGPIAGWGDGGAQQTKVIGTHTDSSSPADPADFADYVWLPSDSYVNGQGLDNKALTYTRLVKTGNTGKMAAYLDLFNPDDGTDLADVYTTLDYINYGSDPGPLTAALRQISPERFDALSTVGLRNDLLLADNLWERGRDRREAAEKVKTGVWLQGVGEKGDQKEAAERVGFDYNSEGFVAGFDREPKPGFFLGLAAAGLKNRLDWTGNGGYATQNTERLAVYAGGFTTNAFFDLSVAGGSNQTTARRNLNFTGHGYNTTAGADVVDLSIQRTADSSQNGNSLCAHLQGGAVAHLLGLEASGLGRLSYFNLRQNAFDESGAGSLDLHVNGFRAQTLRTELRLVLSRDLRAAKSRALKPEVAVGWAHSAALDGRHISAGLMDQGEAVTILGDRARTDRFLAGAGLSAELGKNFSLFARYEAETGRGFNSQSIKLGLRCGF